MSGILDSVNMRTELVGKNRLELLIFRLLNKQRYGINVFKVKEILPCPKLTILPNLHPFVKGVAHIRGKTISIIDLNFTIDGRASCELDNYFIIIAEFNRNVQGFIVESVERIVNINWDKVLPLPDNAGSSSYLTAVTEIEGEFVGMLDVERILNEISPINELMSDDFLSYSSLQMEEGTSKAKKILIVDDSNIARKQVKKVIENLGYEVLVAHNGREGLNMLRELAQQTDIHKQLALVISDIEMPKMDGYTLTAEIRKDPDLKDLRVILHSSLSGKFNESMVKRAGADGFIAKFVPDEFAVALIDAIK